MCICMSIYLIIHCAKKPVTSMLTYPWKCTVLHCNHLGNTWKPLVLMTRHFDYHPRSGNNQSVRSSAPVVSRCFPGGYNVKLYISKGRLAYWLLAFLHSDRDRSQEERGEKGLLMPSTSVNVYMHIYLINCIRAESGCMYGCLYVWCISFVHMCSFVFNI